MTNSFRLTTANLPTLRKLHLLKPEIISIYRDWLIKPFAGLPRRTLAYGNSRFCIEKITKPADEHHLQVSPRFCKPAFAYRDNFRPSNHYCAQHGQYSKLPLRQAGQLRYGREDLSEKHYQPY
jgi:hypothetical protein